MAMKRTHIPGLQIPFILFQHTRLNQRGTLGGPKAWVVLDENRLRYWDLKDIYLNLEGIDRVFLPYSQDN